MSGNGIDVLYYLLSTWYSQVLFLAVGSVLAIFAAYRSFTVSRALVVRSYRRRALWLGVVNISIVVFIVSYLTSIIFPVAPLVIGDSITTLLALIFFVWIDSTVNVALGQDYFHRDTLYWRRLRIPFWIGVGITLFVNAISYSYFSFSFSPLYLVSTILYAIMFGYAGAVLTVGALRTTDVTLRSHFRWIALGLLAATLYGFAPYALFVLVGDVTVYFFYRASRSLYPMGHLIGK